VKLALARAKWLVADVKYGSAPDIGRLRVLLDLVVQAVVAEPAYSIAGRRPAATSADPTLGAPPSGPARAPDEAARRPAEPKPADIHLDTWGLVSRTQQGDSEAFGQLYDRYFDTVYRYIYYRVYDRATAEDFTSETFLRALRRIGSVTNQGRDIGAWLVTIARNIVIDHVKSARNRLEVTTPEIVESSDREPGPEAAVLNSLTTEHLMRAVGQLGHDQRDCITLRFIQGLSVSETARAMGKNDGTVKALQHRAVRKLADLVRGELQ
jgi:RNA polymerase sigma-70 factor, ECF subfamily